MASSSEVAPERRIAVNSPVTNSATTGVGPPAAAPAAPSASFRHPQADREIHLREHLVAYALKRVRRRSIGFIVGAEGLSVNAPRWVGLGDIEAALREKADWILRNGVKSTVHMAPFPYAYRYGWDTDTAIDFALDHW